jgi:hypothetical protein
MRDAFLYMVIGALTVLIYLGRDFFWSDLFAEYSQGRATIPPVEAAPGTTSPSVAKAKWTHRFPFHRRLGSPTNRSCMGDEQKGPISTGD